jgi:hypothetical protein
LTTLVLVFENLSLVPSRQSTRFRGMSELLPGEGRNQALKCRR